MPAGQGEYCQFSECSAEDIAAIRKLPRLRVEHSRFRPSLAHPAAIYRASERFLVH